MKKLNKKGFTLVELLAVIVVLAIIMIIAVPAVLESMDTAKKNTLVIEGRKALNAAMSKYQSDVLMGTVPTLTTDPEDATKKVYCYSLSDLGVDGGGKYTGKVTIGEDKTTYKVYIGDTEYAIMGKQSSELDPKVDTTYETSYPTTGFDC